MKNTHFPRKTQSDMNESDLFKKESGEILKPLTLRILTGD